MNPLPSLGDLRLVEIAVGYHLKVLTLYNFEGHIINVDPSLCRSNGSKHQGSGFTCFNFHGLHSIFPLSLSIASFTHIGHSTLLKSIFKVIYNITRTIPILEGQHRLFSPQKTRCNKFVRNLCPSRPPINLKVLSGRCSKTIIHWSRRFTLLPQIKSVTWGVGCPSTPIASRDGVNLGPGFKNLGLLEISIIHHFNYATLFTVHQAYCQKN